MKVLAYNDQSMTWREVVNDGRIDFFDQFGRRYRLKEMSNGQLTLSASDGPLEMKPSGCHRIAFKTS